MIYDAKSLLLLIASYPLFISLSSWGAVSREKREKRCFALSRAGCRFLHSGALMTEERIYCSLLALFSSLVTAVSNFKVQLLPGTGMTTAWWDSLPDFLIK